MSRVGGAIFIIIYYYFIYKKKTFFYVCIPLIVRRSGFHNVSNLKWDTGDFMKKVLLATWALRDIRDR